MTRHLPQTDETIDQNISLKTALDQAAQKIGKDETADIMEQRRAAIRELQQEARK